MTMADNIHILQISDPTELTVLHNYSTIISPEEMDEYQDILKWMLERVSVRSNKAVWLALPQVWYNKRWFVVHAYSAAKVLLRWVFINPKITWKSDRKQLALEECLSELWVKKQVRRHESITLQYINALNDYRTVKFYWYHARVIQHEMDHLDGILLIDK